MKFSLEFSNLERRSTLEAAHEKATKLDEKYSINIETFKDLYGEQTITTDQAELERLEQKFKEQETPHSREAKVLADIMEAIIFEQGEKSDWFGPTATTIKTSRYDDVKNGIDAIVEFEEKKKTTSHVGLAIDATYTDEIDKKVLAIKRKIDSGGLGVIKYFESEQSAFRGELSKIPITIITANARTVQELADLWVNNPKALADHWIQFQILGELIGECEIFSDYAKKVSQTEIADRYEHIKQIGQQILIEKQDKIKDTGQRDNNFLQTMSKIKWLLNE